jgi:hypothetical protein
LITENATTQGAMSNKPTKYLHPLLLIFPIQHLEKIPNVFGKYLNIYLNILPREEEG